MKISKKYFIIAGILLWGIPTGIIFSIIFACMKPNSFFEISIFQLDRFLKFAPAVTIVFSFLGILVGLVLFRICNKYNK